jgi:hypothetical protein
MAETLHVKAVPGVLARDPRVTSSHTFVGRTRAPSNGPGLTLGRISATLYDAAKLHKGEPIDVDETFPIIEEGVELVFDTSHKHPGVKLEEQKALARVKKLIAENALTVVQSTAAAGPAPADAHVEEHAK